MNEILPLQRRINSRHTVTIAENTQHLRHTRNDVLYKYIVLLSTPTATERSYNPNNDIASQKKLELVCT